MPQDKDEEGLSENAKAGMRFAKERMADEAKAKQDLKKDPVGPIKARARTQAMMKAARSGANAYKDWPKKRSGGKSEWTDSP